MSLRRDIHSAFETIAPPLGGMPERVAQTVLANKRRQRKEGMLLRFREPLSLVAVFLLIALVAAVLVGGRLIQNWSVLHNSAPAGHGSAALARLEARPVDLPVLAASDPCPATQTSANVPYEFGSGPVYGDGGWQINRDWGYYYDVLYYTPKSMTGPVLIRGRDLRSDRIVVFVSHFSAGPVVGTDQSDAVDQHSEAVLDSGNPQARDTGGYGEFHVRQGIAKGFTGCVGIQIDGATFSEKIIGDAPPS